MNWLSAAEVACIVAEARGASQVGRVCSRCSRSTKPIPLHIFLRPFLAHNLARSTTMTSLTSKRLALEAAGKPIQVGLIGAGKFGSMFISQAHRTPGLRLAGIADLSKDRAFSALKRTGYPEERVDWDGKLSLEDGIQQGKTVVTTASAELIRCGRVDVVLEVTGSPAAGVKHALLVCLDCSLNRIF